MNILISLIIFSLCFGLFPTVEFIAEYSPERNTGETSRIFLNSIGLSEYNKSFFISVKNFLSKEFNYKIISINSFGITFSFTVNNKNCRIFVPFSNVNFIRSL